MFKSPPTQRKFQTNLGDNQATTSQALDKEVAVVHSDSTIVKNHPINLGDPSVSPLHLVANNDNDWKIVPSKKRARPEYFRNNSSSSSSPPVRRRNKFEFLSSHDVEDNSTASIVTNDAHNNNTEGKLTSLNPHNISTATISHRNQQKSDTNKNSQNINIDKVKKDKIPPILVKNVVNISSLRNDLLSDPSLKFILKSTMTGVTVIPENSDTYRKIIKLLREKKYFFYTYQLSEEKLFRVVLRNLHPSTDVKEIQSEIESKGFNVKAVTNVIHPKTKLQLPMHFIDLFPSSRNDDIFLINALLYTRVVVEELKTNKHMIQCKRCQLYGHSQNYCNLPFRCIKCGKKHNSNACTKEDSVKPVCALCQGDHPANYRGCLEYKRIIQERKDRLYKRSTIKYNPENHNFPPITIPNSVSANAWIKDQNLNSRETTHNITSNSVNNSPDNTGDNYFVLMQQFSTQMVGAMDKLMNDFKLLITPLLSILTKLMDKLT